MSRGIALLSLLFAAFGVSCGESTGDDAASGSEPVVAECPDIAPRSMSSEPCPENLPAEGCTYALDCASGPRDFTFACQSQFWFVEPSPCERQSEFCTGGEQQVRCDESPVEGEGLVWGAAFAAFDGPAPCPTETQHHGDSCADSTYSMLGCGYFCEDGTTWTSGSCDYVEGTDEQAWVFDGACDP